MLEVLFAFVGAFTLTPMLYEPAYRTGLVDFPSARKSHGVPVPVVGGIAMVLTFSAGVLILEPAYDPLVALLCVTLFVAVVGVIDDRRELLASTKLAAQVVAATATAVWGGQVLQGLGDPFGTGAIQLQTFATAFTVFTIVGVMNAMNMLDGLDGLAGGTAIICFLWLGTAALLSGSFVQVDVLLIWLGAVAGFLLFNLRYPVRQRAQVFMGDAGSLVLGLTLAWFCIDLTQQPSGRGLYPISAVWIMALPVMDTLYVLGRRICNRNSPFAPDRRHVHHTLLDMGVRPGWVVFVMFAASAAFGAVGVLGWYWRVPEPTLGYGLLLTFAAYCLVMQVWPRLALALGLVPSRLPPKRLETTGLHGQ
jgi:UDP-GlcNAc:undecaprenyl-phosphate GlcNAc-1-phosphate transferase